jgi:hypothetical protein
VTNVLVSPPLTVVSVVSAVAEPPLPTVAVSRVLRVSRPVAVTADSVPVAVGLLPGSGWSEPVDSRPALPGRGRRLGEVELLLLPVPLPRVGMEPEGAAAPPLLGSGARPPVGWAMPDAPALRVALVKVKPWEGVTKEEGPTPEVVVAVVEAPATI